MPRLRAKIQRPLSCVALIAATLLFSSEAAPARSADTPLQKSVLSAMGLANRRLKSVQLSGQSSGGTYSAFTGKLNPEIKRVEFRVLLPDSYVRIDAPPGVLQRNGFSRGVAIQSQVALSPDVQVSPGSPVAWLVPIMRTGMARWMVGLFASTDFGPDVTVRVTERPRRLTFIVDKDRIDIDVDARTSLPLRMRYKTALSLSEVTQRNLGIRIAGDGNDEVAIEFSDRTVVDGVSVPRLLQMKVQGASLERITLDTIRINPPLTLADFKF